MHVCMYQKFIVCQNKTIAVYTSGIKGTVASFKLKSFELARMELARLLIVIYNLASCTSKHVQQLNHQWKSNQKQFGVAVHIFKIARLHWSVHPSCMDLLCI